MHMQLIISTLFCTALNRTLYNMQYVWEFSLKYSFGRFYRHSRPSDFLSTYVSQPVEIRKLAIVCLHTANKFCWV